MFILYRLRPVILNIVTILLTHTASYMPRTISVTDQHHIDRNTGDRRGLRKVRLKRSNEAADRLKSSLPLHVSRKLQVLNTLNYFYWLTSPTEFLKWSCLVMIIEVCHVYRCILKYNNMIFFFRIVIPFRNCICECICSTSHASDYNISPGGKGTNYSTQLLNPLLRLSY